MPRRTARSLPPGGNPPCKGTNAKGDPCGNRAKTGSDYCASHLGDAHRRTKLTPQIHAAIVQALEAGCYQGTAAQMAGVGETTYYAWLERGEADLDTGYNRTPYAAFREAVTRARANAQGQAIAMIRMAGMGRAPGTLSGLDTGLAPDWRALAWYLERSFPSEYGRREHVEHAHSDVPAERLVEQVDERREALIRMLRTHVDPDAYPDPEDPR